MLKNGLNMTLIKILKINKKMFIIRYNKTVFDKETKIKIFDKCIGDLYDFGYLHNHMRMYIALYNKCG